MIRTTPAPAASAESAARSSSQYYYICCCTAYCKRNPNNFKSNQMLSEPKRYPNHLSIYRCPPDWIIQQQKIVLLSVLQQLLYVPAAM